MLPDGRVIYSRWEYTDKQISRVQSLWTMNQDGTGVAVFWGNQSIWPDHQAQAQGIQVLVILGRNTLASALCQSMLAADTKSG